MASAIIERLSFMVDWEYITLYFTPDQRPKMFKGREFDKKKGRSNFKISSGTASAKVVDSYIFQIFLLVCISVSI